MEMMMTGLMSGEMESSEELEVSKTTPSQIVKRKRTKRRRQVSSSSSSGSGGGQSEEDRNSTVTTSEEDEDMANCLILLARGGVGTDGDGAGDFSGVDLVVKSLGEDSGRKRKRKSAETSPVSGEMSLSPSQVYECKTCEKSFQSFQALGGHRASHHKKPKLTMEDGVAPNDIIKQEQEPVQILVKPHPVPVKASSTTVSASASVSPSFVPVKSHECAICGSAFSSGQALGGHMRRHRAVTTATTPVTVAETSSLSSRPSFLSLDLNLPAPADDEHHHHHVVNFHHQHRQQFQIQNNNATGTVTAPPLVFSAPALVDCYF